MINSKRQTKGIFLKHLKNTQEQKTIKMPLPSLLTIPMLQHMGTPCEVIVKVGDYVKTGDKVGDSEEMFSAPIHAPASGKIIAIDDYTSVGGVITKCVVIQTDSKQELSSQITPPVIHNKEDFLKAVRESGLVGLGGAGFPAHVKLSYPDTDKLDTLVINAAECEPYITSDYREMMENTKDIIECMKVVQKYLNIKNAYIGIEDNKPEAIKILDDKTSHEQAINVVKLKSKYPQGAEKVIIYTATGRVVQDGQLPADCGVIVMNVSSIAFLARYIKTGVPLVSRRLTVDGDCVKKPQNVEVLIGTSLKEVLGFCDYDEQNTKMILMGGPMMGVANYSPKAPVIKNNNAILALSERQAIQPPTTACIKCSKCVYVCPVNLMPLVLEKAHDSKNLDELKNYSANLCINCGCCSYICPAKRNLAQKIQLGKAMLKNTQ